MNRPSNMCFVCACAMLCQWVSRHCILAHVSLINGLSAMCRACHVVLVGTCPGVQLHCRSALSHSLVVKLWGVGLKGIKNCGQVTQRAVVAQHNSVAIQTCTCSWQHPSGCIALAHSVVHWKR